MTTKNVSETSTIDGSKWHHGITADNLTKLRGLADEINTVVQGVVTEATKGQIKVGRLLVEAREMFPGDDQFGKWRQANTTIGSKESANKLMNLARQCGTGRITEDLVSSLSVSTLKELLTAPDSVIQKIATRVAEGDIPSKNETREMVRESKGGGSSMLEDMQELDDVIDLERAGCEVEPERQRAKVVNMKGPSEPAKPPVQSHYDTRAKAVDTILKMKMAERIAKLGDMSKPPYPSCLPVEWAWMVIGLDPSPAYMHSREAVDALHDYYTEQLDGPFIKNLEALQGTLKRAMDLIEEEYKNG